MPFSLRAAQGLLLAPQPLLTVAYVIAVATYQTAPSLRPILALGALPAVALALEPLAGRPRSALAIGVALAELAWAGAAAWLVATTARHAGLA